MQGVLVWALVLIYRCWSATWRYRFVQRDVFESVLADGPAVFAFWHGEQLAVFAPHGHRGICGMASRSRDGELLARCIQRLGYGVIRGSSSRGGVTALRAAMTEMQGGRSAALAVDGPRGPRHEPHLGALRIASELQRPLVYVVSHARRAITLRSWDRFVLPLPFARITVGYGQMDITTSSRDALEGEREVLRERMETLGRAIRQETISSCHPLASTLVG